MAAHGLLDNISDLLGRLIKDLVHVLSHGVLSAKVLVSGLSSLGIGVQTCLVLLQEFLLDGDVVVSNAQDCKAVFWLLDLFVLLSKDLGDQLILDQNEGLHRVLKSQLVFTHLRKDGTNVKMDISWIEHLEAIVDALVAVMKIVVLNFQGFLEI